MILAFLSGAPQAGTDPVQYGLKANHIGHNLQPFLVGFTVIAQLFKIG
jgi:hypothetical protein